MNVTLQHDLKLKRTLIRFQVKHWLLLFPCSKKVYLAVHHRLTININIDTVEVAEGVVIYSVAAPNI